MRNSLIILVAPLAALTVGCNSVYTKEQIENDYQSCKDLHIAENTCLKRKKRQEKFLKNKD